MARQLPVGENSARLQIPAGLPPRAVRLTAHPGVPINLASRLSSYLAVSIYLFIHKAVKLSAYQFAMKPVH